MEEVTYNSAGALFEIPFREAQSLAGCLREKYPADWDGSENFMRAE